MLEGQPPITDPRIAQLLQRLQSTRERWHQRGYEDGITWAVELATHDELQNVATYMADMDGQQLVVLFKMQGQTSVASATPLPASPPFPPMPPGAVTTGDVGYRVIHKQPASTMPPLPSEPHQVVIHQHAGKPFPGFPESFHPGKRLRHWWNQDREMSGQTAGDAATRIDVDNSAYLEGWRDAVKGIWQTIAPALS